MYIVSSLRFHFSEGVGLGKDRCLASVPYSFFQNDGSQVRVIGLKRFGS